MYSGLRECAAELTVKIILKTIKRSYFLFNVMKTCYYKINNNNKNNKFELYIR